ARATGGDGAGGRGRRRRGGGTGVDAPGGGREPGEPVHRAAGRQADLRRQAVRRGGGRDPGLRLGQRSATFSVWATVFLADLFACPAAGTPDRRPRRMRSTMRNLVR